MKYLKSLALLIGILSLMPLTINAADYDFYVDKSSSSSTEPGTEANPYKTITKAIEASLNNPEANRRIYIKNGEYSEKITLEKGVKLFGQDKTQTIILGDDTKTATNITVAMKDNTQLDTLTVKKGFYGIHVNADSLALINNCVATDTWGAGVRVLSATINDAVLFTLQNSDISNNNKKGVEIDKRKILISDNTISNNKEEGIDLRARDKGTISGNTIHSNHEGGIEVEMKQLDLKIKNNSIRSNKASGINLQFRNGYSKNNNVTLSKNTISKNRHYGIRCSRPMGGSMPKEFFSSDVDLSGNKINSNRWKKYSSLCKF